MENVYDLVADFYENDEEWNQILSQEYVEGFLRKAAWQGATDAELKKQWNSILMLCIYLGHGDRYLGDLTVDDIIDIVAWCGRNVAEFKISFATVKELLETWGELYVYLKSKRVVFSSLAPHLAKGALLKDDGTLAIINAKGEFLPGEETRWHYALEDGPSPIFLNVGETMGHLLAELHGFFQQDCFNLDLERAVFFYQGFTKQEEKMSEASSEEFWQTFWDYFLFDYHLLLDDQTPLKHFSQKKISKHQELVKELCKSRLALFAVQKTEDGEIYTCTDFFTGETYDLNLPLDPSMDTENMLVMGHIFYNKTMVMNYVRCFKISPLGQKRLRQQLESFYQWYLRQVPDGTKETFIARHPMVLRRAVYFAAHYAPFATFAYETKLQDYVPPVYYRRDKVVACLEKMMVPQHFSCHDVLLVRNMWLDFLRAKKKVERQTAEFWAGGIILNFIELNTAYSYTTQSVANMCWHMPIEDLVKSAAIVKDALQLETYDPRYCNEEGVLTMLLNEGHFRRTL